ncbi:hypothetical protein RVR_10520 [Actinacidiphila reveromycinica]|uniref:DUF6286 domain-containing protein n=2 Tax=Actinacidiphila reveromycinica TaxID=659352 RepID=A0A7U3VQ40_9ACTN|nr:hypothetical protein RVR_10520 [Streptomyces sp. SN-593]
MQRSSAPKVQLRRPGRRVWVARRLPMAAVMLVGSICVALLLADVVAVHATGRAPAPWRVRLLDALERHGPGQHAVTLAGLVAALVGIWLLCLALTPGRRGLLTMDLGPFGRVAPGSGEGALGASSWSDPGSNVGIASQTPLSLRATVERRTVAYVVCDAVADVPGIAGPRATVGRRRVRVHAQVAFGDREEGRASVSAAAERALRGMKLVHSPRLRCAVRAAPHWRPVQSAVDPGEEGKGDGSDA